MPSAASAQAPKLDITVSPAITEWALKPGEKQTKTLRVINPKDTPIPLRVVVEAMSVQEKVVLGDQPVFDASSWFTVADPYFILKAKEIREVKVTLTLPKTAEPGGHYATIFFQQFVPSSNERRTVVAGQVGALAFVTAKGRLDQRLELEGGPVRVDERENGSIDFALTLKNEGNVHLLPTGKFVVRDWLGRTVTTLPLPAGIILPHTKRSYVATWKQPPLLGYVTVTAEVEYGEKPVHLMSLPYGLWVSPGKWTVAFSILLALLLWSIWRWRRRLLRALTVLFSAKFN